MANCNPVYMGNPGYLAIPSVASQYVTGGGLKFQDKRDHNRS